MRRITFLSVLIWACASQSVCGDPPFVPGYTVSWFDEFDGSAIDSSLWNVITSTNPTNNSLHTYQPSQVTVDGGNLVITSDNVPVAGFPYRSGQVISKNAQQYGRWEVRAKLPTSTGMWPAIWLLPDVATYPWPSQGEIDIMENRGTQPHLTSSAYHWGTNPPFSHSFVDNEQQAYIGGQAANYHDSFHTYAVEWEPDQLRFYVDDVHHYTVSDATTGGFLSSQTAAMETVINTAVGGDFLTNPDGSTIWPQEFLIDYVHVYHRTEQPLQLRFENGGFEDDGVSAAKWSTFGNRIPNLRGSTQQARSGQGSMKVFGQFTGSENFSGIAQGIDVVAGEELRAMASSFVDSNDSISGTGNRLVLKIDYYSQQHGEFGSADYISSEEILIADGASASDVWRDHELRSTAPASAVEARMALVFQQPGVEGGAVFVDDTLFGKRGDYTLHWDGLGDGTWNTAGRWTGAALDVPSDFDNAVIENNRVTVASLGQAFNTTVTTGGTLEIDGQLSGDVAVASDAAMTTSGMLDGNLFVAGAALYDGSTLLVSGDAELDQALLQVDDGFSAQRGTVIEDELVLSAASLTGTIATPADANADSHLGDGYFLESISYTATDVLVDVYAALPGDANGDGVVNGTDFMIWNEFKFQNDTDWLQGDFNADGLTDGRDLLIWNEFKFSSVPGAAGPSAVPEPATLWTIVLVVCWWAGRRRGA